jgi:predicted nucleic acid-binding protein
VSDAPKVAVLDACVLYPPTLRDFLLWLAAGSVYAPRLTDEIHEEWIRNALRDYPDLTAVRLAHTRDLMNRVSLETLVTSYEEITESLTLPDPNDRHVLAAAIHSGATVIVTFNLKHFPVTTLATHGITAEPPDAFIVGLMENGRRQRQVIEMARQARANLKNPPKSVEEYLDGLRRNRLSRVADLLAEHADQL